MASFFHGRQGMKNQLSQEKSQSAPRAQRSLLPSGGSTALPAGNHRPLLRPDLSTTESRPGRTGYGAGGQVTSRVFSLIATCRWEPPLTPLSRREGQTLAKMPASGCVCSLSSFSSRIFLKIRTQKIFTLCFMTQHDNEKDFFL